MKDVNAPVRTSQVSDMEDIQEHHKYVSGGLANRNRRVRSMIYPAVSDIIEDDEESAREPLYNWVVKERQSEEQQMRENVIVGVSSF